ncbi:probable oligoribonuclease isoform X2 [Hermetia illucens]|nr:probable oligoribonuclease isoform X2 [Hermetia illucens]
MPSDKNKNCIVWMDLEMTGLEEKDTILEASCILTDENLNIVAEGPNIVIHQPDSVLNSMNDWCKKHHQETGLTDQSRNSKISTEEAEKALLKFVEEYIPPKTCPLAGNSVYMDRLFLRKYMPQLNDYLHYRIIDVSSVKELCKRWNPTLFSQAPQKKLVHRSLDDIKESIEELKYYKRYMFLNDPEVHKTS